MAWRVALRPEIVAGLYKAHAKELLPEAVHGDTGRQGMLRRDEPTGQIEPVGRAVGVSFLQWRQDGGHTRLDFLARLVILAAQHHKVLARLVQVAENERRRDALVEFGALFCQGRKFPSQ